MLAPEDFELARPRAGPLSYRMSWDGKSEAAGLVFLIPGFGADASSDYCQGLRDRIARAGYLAVSVEYHCLGARPETGGAIEIGADERLRLIGAAHVLGAHVADRNSIDAITRAVGGAKAGVLARGTLKPARGEYQNFGVVQALDHIAALGDLIARGPAFDRSKIIAFGSSHGGYIAHLMAKFAPRSLSAVFDNSSYVQPPYSYLGIGAGAEFRELINGVFVDCEVESGWTLARRDLPNAYTRDADLIRDAGYLPHAVAMRGAAGANGPLFRMANAAVDAISPPEAKRRQTSALVRAGFDARLELIDENGIDGSIFKATSHGLDASLGALFDRWIGEPGSRAGALDCERGTVMEYACVDRGYVFRHAKTAPYISGETFDLFASELAQAS